jgi:hypothetical protein
MTRARGRRAYENDSVGTRLAIFAARYGNVLTVIGPDHAIATVTGDLHQRTAWTFTGGRRARIGRRGLDYRLSATGPGTRTNAQAPRAVFDVAGNLVSSG